MDAVDAGGTRTAPIFIIGSPRSGTTLLRMILDSHPHISCGPETHFLVDLRRLAEAHGYRVERFGFDQAYWDDRVRDFYTAVHVDYMQRRGKLRWAEKTPVYTLHLDYVDRLFPDAQYIHIVRDGRDVVASHLDRWGQRSAMRATGLWGQYVTAAQEFGRTCAPGRFIEIRYEDLVADAEGTLRPLFELLQEPWDPGVLSFDEKQHDGAHFDEFTAARRAESGESAAIYTSRVGAGGTQLNPVLRRLLDRRGGELMGALGYRS